MAQGDVIIRQIALPYTIKGVTLPNNDGTYSIYINTTIPQEQQEKALRHELTHVDKGHLHDPYSVADNEAEAAPADCPIIPEELVFARGGGILHGASRERMLAILNATYSLVAAQLPAVQGYCVG